MRLELRDVWHVYSAGTEFEVPALRGVSLDVEEGEVLGIVGGTGSGKSTLVQHMNLLLAPTSGRVLVDGVDAGEMKKSALRRRVGLAFQFPEQGLFAPTVEEDVAFAPRQLRLDERGVRERVDESLGLLGIEDLRRRSPYSLSGGEQRRAALAGILAMRPEILILDEPTAGLDPAARESLLGVIVTLREKGVSVVLVSHDLDEVSEVADRVCLMDRGEIRAIGDPAEVFYSDPGVAPATVRTIDALRREYPGLGRPVRLEETLAALRGLLEV
ncbi:MAG: ATP-binding cassette domain-containing protein [Rubrobacteraceae bacterium]